MEITVKKEDIVLALNTTLGVVEKRQTLPILANVLLEVNENSFKLTATDLESEVTTRGPLSSVESADSTLDNGPLVVTSDSKSVAVNLNEFSLTSNKTFARIGSVCLFSTTPSVVLRARTISSFLTVISI